MSESAATNSRKPSKILIIDDEPEAINAIKMLLEANGYVVVTALNGNEGIQVAFSEKPDLVLLDIIMPGLSGHQVLRHLKATESTRDTPVIMLTAKGELDSIEQSIKFRSADHMIKPVQPNELLVRIEKAIKLHAALYKEDKPAAETPDPNNSPASQ